MFVGCIPHDCRVYRVKSHIHLCENVHALNDPYHPRPLDAVRHSRKKRCFSVSLVLEIMLLFREILVASAFEYLL